MQKCNWKYIISQVDCIQKNNLIDVVRDEIKKITSRDNSSGLDVITEKVVVGFSFVSANEKLSQDGKQYNLWSPNLSIEVKCNKQTEIYFSIEIQDYISCMGTGDFFGQSVEYSILVSNNGFNWRIKEIKKIN
jgi:hypothetical protein